MLVRLALIQVHRKFQLAQRRSNYTSTVSLTSVLDGEGGQCHVPAALPLARGPVRIVQDDAWAPGSVWTGVEYLDPPPQPKFDPRTVHLVASRYTDYATPAHENDDDDSNNTHNSIVYYKCVGTTALMLITQTPLEHNTRITT